ncbi:MAG: right-handed parallel beta-helix repeat-containing protein, partial [Nanoarchaeota archaeon]
MVIKKLVVFLMLFLSMVMISNAIDVTQCTMINVSGDYQLANDLTFPGAGIDCITFNASNIILDCKGYSIQHINANGIDLMNTTGSTVKNCVMTNISSIGIYGGHWEHGGADNNKIINNSISLTGQDGIQFAEGSHDNLIENNTLMHISEYGIWILGTIGGAGVGANDTIINSNIIHNSTAGVVIEYTLYVNVTNNNISYVPVLSAGLRPEIDGAGIAYLYSQAGVVYHNNVSDTLNATMLMDSDSNLIYNNNFIDNIINSFDNGTGNNWNTTDSGNYWSNFDTAGEGCTDAGSGLCNEDYTIPGISGAKDYNPYNTVSGWLGTGASDADNVAPIVTLNTNNNSIFGSTTVSLN